MFYKNFRRHQTAISIHRKALFIKKPLPQNMTSGAHKPPSLFPMFFAWFLHPLFADFGNPLLWIIRRASIKPPQHEMRLDKMYIIFPIFLSLLAIIIMSRLYLLSPFFRKFFEYQNSYTYIFLTFIVPYFYTIILGKFIRKTISYYYARFFAQINTEKMQITPKLTKYSKFSEIYTQISATTTQ